MKSHSKALVFFAVSKQIPVVYSADRGRAEITESFTISNHGRNYLMLTILLSEISCKNESGQVTFDDKCDLRVGSTCKFECLDGYKKTPGVPAVLKCNINGSWSEDTDNLCQGWLSCIVLSEKKVLTNGGLKHCIREGSILGRAICFSLHVEFISFSLILY